jgi:hypothetical protein
MATKTLKFVMSIFALFLFASVVSALSITSYPTTLPQESGTFTITVNNSEGQTGTVVIEDITQGTDIINFAVAGSNALSTGSDVTYNIDYVISSEFDFELGQEYSTTIKLVGSSTNDTETISFEESTFCTGYENEGGLNVEIDDVKVSWGYGDEDDFWFLRDEIEIEVVIENDGNWDVEDVEIEWELYTEDGVLIMDDTEDTFDLDENDDTTITFTFKLDEDIDEFEGNDAILYVRAIGQINDRDSTYDGDDTCAQDNTGRIEVITEDDFVIADEFEINGIEVEDELYSDTFFCGAQVTVAGNLWNIGEDDQDDVYLEIYSNALDVYEKFEYDEVQAFDSEGFSYTFTIPEELDEKIYELKFEVYDEDNDLFENSEDDKAIKSLYLTVEGNCKIVEPVITASLVEENVVEGKDMTITTSVTNMNDNAAVYTLTAQNFESWAKLNSIKPEVVSLNAGETKEVTFSFTLNDESAGSKDFSINVYSGSEVVATQPVSVNVEEGSAFNVGKVIDRETLQVIGIILLNVLLIIAIIVVARRILRKK